MEAVGRRERKAMENIAGESGESGNGRADNFGRLVMNDEEESKKEGKMFSNYLAELNTKLAVNKKQFNLMTTIMYDMPCTLLNVKKQGKL